VKARVRRYPGIPGRVFPELKFRDGDVIRKTRAPLPEESWTEFVRRGGGPENAQHFSSLVARLGLRPIVLVRYRREAWMSLWDEYARVSIDFEVACKPANGWTYEIPGSWRPVDHPVWTQTQESICVLELKWADVAPRWMAELVGALDLNRQSFSKYCYSMRTLGEQHRIDERRSTARWVS